MVHQTTQDIKKLFVTYIYKINSSIKNKLYYVNEETTWLLYLF